MCHVATAASASLGRLRWLSLQLSVPALSFCGFVSLIVHRQCSSFVSIGVSPSPFALGIWHLFADHVHLKRNGLKVFEERLSAGSIALRRKRRLGCDFAEPFCEVRRIEEKAGPSVLLRNISERLLGIHPRPIERAATSDGPLVPGDDFDPEIA